MRTSSTLVEWMTGNNIVYHYWIRTAAQVTVQLSVLVIVKKYCLCVCLRACPCLSVSVHTVLLWLQGS